MKCDTQYKLSKAGKTGIMFDFGVNTAGIFELRLSGRKNQEIFIQTAEYMKSDGSVSYANVCPFYPDGYCQTALYICKGEENESFRPKFTYYGYRYAVVFGLDDDQISEDTLKMIVANSDLKVIGGFCCSDETMNKLGRMCLTSDLANFYYFPTDCPHREKNGWSGDAAISAEHMILTLSAEKSFAEWLRNICKGQRSNGEIPGIIPNPEWCWCLGDGPVWENILTELCYMIYRYRGDLTPARECCENILRYLSFLAQRRNEEGLIDFGLGDWYQPTKSSDDSVAPIYVTSSVFAMYIAEKSRILFEALGLDIHAGFAETLRKSLREAIRKHCINFSTMTVDSQCQTAQAVCIYYGVFDDSEKARACDVLVKLIHEKNDHMDGGMIGVRTMFHVLSEAGYGDLAFRMITRHDFPSYGLLIDQGLTSMPENFLPAEKWDRPASLNHHFMGDLPNWFISKVVGIRINENIVSPDHIDIKPDFITDLDFAEGYHITPMGRISVRWERKEDKIILDIGYECELKGKIVLPDGYIFSDQEPNIIRHRYTVTPLKPGSYEVMRKTTY